MYYRELIQFDPIETTIELIESDDKAKAQELVSTTRHRRHGGVNRMRTFKPLWKPS